MPPSKKVERRILERRRKVSQLRLAGVRDQRTIAAKLEVSLGTINSDFKALDDVYRERSAEDIATAKGQDLERIDELIAALWTEAKRGKWLAIDRIIALMERRARLLGLDAPHRIDIEMRVRQLAADLGLDPDEAVVEAQRVIRESRARG